MIDLPRHRDLVDETRIDQKAIKSNRFEIMKAVDAFELAQVRPRMAHDCSILPHLSNHSVLVIVQISLSPVDGADFVPNRIVDNEVVCCSVFDAAEKLLISRTSLAGVIVDVSHQDADVVVAFTFGGDVSTVVVVAISDVELDIRIGRRLFELHDRSSINNNRRRLGLGVLLTRFHHRRHNKKVRSWLVQ